MNKDYVTKVMHVTKELTARERIKFKDVSDAQRLDDIVNDTPVLITIDYYGEVAVHNEHSENKDYTVFILVDTDGQKYATGSEAFMKALEDISDELADSGEDLKGTEIKVYKLPSKNYNGRMFITCSLA